MGGKVGSVAISGEAGEVGEVRGDNCEGGVIVEIEVEIEVEEEVKVKGFYNNNYYYNNNNNNNNNNNDNKGLGEVFNGLSNNNNGISNVSNGGGNVNGNGNVNGGDYDSVPRSDTELGHSTSSSTTASKGKGGYWTIDPEYMSAYHDGVFARGGVQKRRPGELVHPGINGGVVGISNGISNNNNNNNNNNKCVYLII
ncbi:hypothetical protein Glove_590g41 [Diversispora epigaea]|uniref:Fork-head domain-containing protein n=1 Tax=Diversispora epigaea TaxID=1348612 RepID=A0A397GBZ4_9GLOM|nr:hypothetical protein Glove_590g41 [Diversispora epigaea]